MSPVILFAEADPAVSAQYGAALQANGLKTDVAFDGRDALAKAFAVNPSAIVIAPDLAFIDGYELCRLLRDDSRTAGIRRLFVADTVEDDDVTRALSAGAEMVLERSAAVASLSDALHQVLARPHPRRADAKAALSGARLLVRAHQRFRTNKPPLAPPPLRCPSCDVTLVYDHSHVGGVSARFEEQWDYFVCEKCGSFEFRQRTRNLRRTVMLS